jgi:phosphoribosyl 1,2-cyclic phosphodiesterase
VRAGSLHHRARTQSSIAISSNAQDWLLVNASPDILQQIKAFPQLQPARSLRDSGIAAVMLMDAQIDHTTGLLMLREHRGRLPLWCHPLVKEDLTTGNPLFHVLEYYCGVDLHPLALDSAFSIPKLNHLKFEAIPLISNAPPYSPHRDQPQPGDNIGLTVAEEDTGKTLFYAPGLGQMESHVWSAMQKADCVNLIISPNTVKLHSSIRRQAIAPAQNIFYLAPNLISCSMILADNKFVVNSLTSTCLEWDLTDPRIAVDIFQAIGVLGIPMAKFRATTGDGN